MAGVLHGASMICIERDLHLDHALDLGGISLSKNSPLVHIWKQRVAIELRRLAACTDETLCRAARILSNHSTSRRDIDRNGPVRAIIDRGVFGLIKLALKRNPILIPQ